MSETPSGAPSLDDLDQHLNRSGWTIVTRDDRSTEWAKDVGDDPNSIRVVLPSSERVADYAEMASQAVRAIAYQERRPIRDVLEDVSLGGADIVALRFTPNAPSGDAPLRLAHAVVTAAKNLIVGAASALDVSAIVLPSRRPPRAEAFSGQARVGVEQGSFIFRLVLPLSGDWSNRTTVPSDQAALIDDLEPSFGRAVTRRVQTALAAAQEMADDVSAGRSGIQIFGRQVSVVVNATELDAFGSMGGPDREPYAVRFSASPMIVEEVSRSGTVAVTAGQQAIFTEAAEFVRTKQALSDGTLQGLVVQLKRTNALGPGEVIVHSSIDDSDKMRRVRLELGEDDYGVAVLAHRQGLQVRVRGDLAIRGNSQLLTQVSDFEVVGGLEDLDEP